MSNWRVKRKVDKIINSLEDNWPIDYLGTIGGENVKECTRRIMKCIVKTELAVQLNWRGKGDKHAFEILLTCAVVKCAVCKHILTRQETDDRIENVIKGWLKYASDRDGGRKKRKNAEGNQQEPNGLPQ